MLGFAPLSSTPVASFGAGGGSLYPTALPIMRSSTTLRDGGFDAVRATNGLLKVRRLYSAEKMTFRLIHWLSDAQKVTLETTYQSFKTSNLTLAWPEDGASYTVRFGAAPLHVKQAGYWESTVLLLEA